ncbi:transposable element Tcb1 transposase [Trichonephila clavipes]|nr:transposable element Tcb1 transposase [Trichonephila clavipes]
MQITETTRPRRINLESPRVSSPTLWQRFQDDGLKEQSDCRRTLIWSAPGTRYHQENTIERRRYGGAGWKKFNAGIKFLVPNICIKSDNDDRPIYRDVILEQHVRLLQTGAPWVLNFCLWLITLVLTCKHCRRMTSIGITTRMDYHLY